MMGSPYYYDDGNVVFHDCMWSGICTCCMQVLQPDYDYELSKIQVHPLSSTPTNINNNTINNNSNSNSTCGGSGTSSKQLLLPDPFSNAVSPLGAHSNGTQPITPTANCGNHHRNRNAADGINGNHHVTGSAATVAAVVTPASTTLHLHENHLNNHHNHNSIDHINNNSNNDTTNNHHHEHTSSTPATAATTTPASSTTTKRHHHHQRHHNDSERKRRDHLRNAFNILRDQVPRFKMTSKKPPRIQILREATAYVQEIMREAERLETRLSEERRKHENLLSV